MNTEQEHPIREQFRGIVSYQKIIHPEQPTMVLIKLKLDNDHVMNAIIARHALTFLLDVEVDDEITILGHYNHRKQFIIEKYLINHKRTHSNAQPRKPLQYPSKKRPDFKKD